MCGIFGVVAVHGNLSVRQQDFITASTVTGQLRGDDGTGLILNNRNTGTRVYKRAVCGSDFLGTRQGGKAVKALGTSNAVIGHNRKTTSGGDNDNDCHPYNYKSVVGVHNGGIGDVVLRRFDTTGHVAEVDSAKIYAAIENEGDPIKVLEKIHMGSYALVWVDKKTNDICIARNKDRPMWAASSPSGLYFASEPGMLFWLMTRYGLQHKDSKLYELTPNQLYRIPMKDPLNVKREAYTPVSPPLVANTYNNANQAQRNAAWYARAGDVGNHTTHKFMGSTSLLASNFPALKHIADVMDSNYDIIEKSQKDKENSVVPTKRLDVIVTNVEARKGNKDFLDVSGYVYDETNSDTIIPVLLEGVKDEGFKFVERYKAGVKKNQLFTLRGVVRNIRVCADSSVCLAMGCVTTWDDESNEPITGDTQLHALEVDDSINAKLGKFTSVQLDSMWSTLRKVVTVH